MVEKIYEFGIKKIKHSEYQAVVLEDDTHMVIHKDQMSLMFPSNKFKPIFEQQIKEELAALSQP